MRALRDPRPVYVEAIYVQTLGKEYEGDETCIHCRGLSAIGKPIEPRGPFDPCVALVGDKNLAGCANCHWRSRAAECKYCACVEVIVLQHALGNYRVLYTGYHANNQNLAHELTLEEYYQFLCPAKVSRLICAGAPSRNCSKNSRVTRSV